MTTEYYEISIPAGPNIPQEITQTLTELLAHLIRISERLNFIKLDEEATPATDPGWLESSTLDMEAPDGYFKILIGTRIVAVPYWNTTY